MSQKGGFLPQRLTNDSTVSRSGQALLEALYAAARARRSKSQSPCDRDAKKRACATRANLVRRLPGYGFFLRNSEPSPFFVLSAASFTASLPAALVESFTALFASAAACPATFNVAINS